MHIGPRNWNTHVFGLQDKSYYRELEQILKSAKYFYNKAKIMVGIQSWRLVLEFRIHALEGLREVLAYTIPFVACLFLDSCLVLQFLKDLESVEFHLRMKHYNPRDELCESKRKVIASVCFELSPFSHRTFQQIP